MSTKQSKNNNLFYGIISGVFFFFIVLPILVIFKEALDAGGLGDLSNFLNTNTLKSIRNSLSLGVLVVLATTMLSAPLAYLLAKTPLSKYKWIDIVLLIPFMTPPYIASMGWILFFQKKGLLEQLVPISATFNSYFFSLGGLVLVMSLHLCPFMTTILKNALLNIGDNLEDSAAVAGAGFYQRIVKIYVPLLLGNYAIAALLVFVKTLSEYGTPATLGARIGFEVFTTDIHRYATMSPIDFGKAATLSSALVSICLVMWLVQSYITNKRSYNLVGGRSKASGAVVGNKSSIVVVGWLYLGGIIFCGVGIPYFSVLATSLIKLRGYGIAIDNFTFAHYQELFVAGSAGLSAIVTSVFLACSAATIASILGFLTVIVLQKKSKFKKLIESEVLLPEMIPNIVLVIGLMILWNKLYSYWPIYNTLGFMVLVYTLMFLPYAYQYTYSGYMQLSNNLFEAARMSGASSLQILQKITLPLLLKSIMTGWMMIFIIVFRELVAASLISPPNTLTVSTYIVSEFSQGSVSLGMSMAFICVIISTTVLLFLNRFQRKR
ncbi:MAG TPA: iron ABC transporter permease [Candidatus Avacidaminococcus intestinavium]|uniref:Iron ABC transporter permease n=1 Tax=Candidatus Avacidaminococcus intestinavium TaxID=2840684 RepID=A0A9D1MPT6_9FIRM|nr:iron ABC transporter permease [Candidatus Avacidaminococcus intestinavium]